MTAGGDATHSSGNKDCDSPATATAIATSTTHILIRKLDPDLIQITCDV